MQQHLDNLYKLDMQVLKTIRSKYNTQKIVYFDFDGIFSAEMLYDVNEKTLKSAQFSARYAIEMLRHYGFEVNVITGDASGTGLAITQTILQRVPVNNIASVGGSSKSDWLRNAHPNAKSIIYIGEDLFDLDMQEHTVHMTPNNAHPLIQLSADYIIKSSSRDYSVMDAAIVIAQMFDISPFDYVNRTRLTIDTLLKQPIVNDVINVVYNKTQQYDEMLNTLSTHYTTLTEIEIDNVITALSNTYLLTQNDHVLVNDYRLCASVLAVQSTTSAQMTLTIIDNDIFTNVTAADVRALIGLLATFVLDNSVKTIKVRTKHLHATDKVTINNVILELLTSDDMLVDQVHGVIAANAFVDYVSFELIAADDNDLIIPS